MIGLLAVVLALGGTSFAGMQSDRKVTKSKVKAIATKQVNSLASGLTVKSADNATSANTANTANTANSANTANTANSANTANTANTANSAGIARNVLSANVASDGTMVTSVPAGATSSRVNEGDYRVSFGRSISGCTLSASPSSTSGGPPLGFVAVGVIDANTLQVFSRNTTNVVVDRPFSVQAICPA